MTDRTIHNIGLLAVALMFVTFLSIGFALASVPWTLVGLWLGVALGVQIHRGNPHE